MAKFVSPQPRQGHCAPNAQPPRLRIFPAVINHPLDLPQTPCHRLKISPNAADSEDRLSEMQSMQNRSTEGIFYPSRPLISFNSSYSVCRGGEPGQEHDANGAKSTTTVAQPIEPSVRNKTKGLQGFRGLTVWFQSPRRSQVPRAQPVNLH